MKRGLITNQQNVKSNKNKGIFNILKEKLGEIPINTQDHHLNFIDSQKY